MSSRRRIVFWIAALAVVFHGMVPLLAAMGAGGRAWTEVCSTFGSQWVQVDEDGAPAAPGDETLGKRCPLCLAGGHFALVAGAFALPAPGPIVAAAPPAHAGAAIAARHPAAAPPRGPPAHA